MNVGKGARQIKVSYLLFDAIQIKLMYVCFLPTKIDFKLGLIKFLVPINIHSFVFSPYKIKSHFLVPVTFSLSILGTKTVDGNF